MAENLTGRERNVLRCLHRGDGLTVGEVAEQADLDQEAARNVLRRLQVVGYVNSAEVTTHFEGEEPDWHSSYHLTSMGRAVLAAAEGWYGYGWEKLYRATRTLTTADGLLADRLHMAWHQFHRLHGGEQELPDDLRERYEEIFHRVDSADGIRELDDDALDELAEGMFDLYVETERRHYGLGPSFEE